MAHAKQSLFGRFAEKTTQYSGSTTVFVSAVGLVVLWAATGHFFQYSETWQLVINTSTTIITFLMVFLIQRAQNKAVLHELRSLRAWRKQHGLDPATAAKTSTELPFKVFEDHGFTILVGRNAANNDLLTQKYAHKDDLWLHAKDVTGSHVVIRHRSGHTVPEPVVERAAQLAGWYSRRQHDSLCPVTVTPKKFVRKPKGALPGQVVVERERVVLVVPANPFEHAA